MSGVPPWVPVSAAGYVAELAVFGDRVGMSRAPGPRQFSTLARHPVEVRGYWAPTIEKAEGIDRMMSRFSTITVENIGPVARLTLARPGARQTRSTPSCLARSAGLSTKIRARCRPAGRHRARRRRCFLLRLSISRSRWSAGPSGVEAWRTILRHDFDTIMDNTAPRRADNGRHAMAVMQWPASAVPRRPQLERHVMKPPAARLSAHTRQPRRRRRCAGSTSSAG